MGGRRWSCSDAPRSKGAWCCRAAVGSHVTSLRQGKPRSPVNLLGLRGALSLPPLPWSHLPFGLLGRGDISKQEQQARGRDNSWGIQPPPGDPPAVLPSRRRTDRQTGRVAALLWSNSSPGKQAGCLPARACKCERGKGAIFKEEPLLSQTAEKGSYGPHYQPPPAHRTTVRGEEMPRRSPRVYRSRCDNRYQLINTSEHRQPGPAARSRAGSRGFILGLCVNKSRIPMQSYRKNMLQASGFGATQMKPAATISLLQPQPLTCSLWQVAVPAESAALNVYFSGNKRYLQWEICSEQSSNEAASRHGRTPQ